MFCSALRLENRTKNLISLYIRSKEPRSVGSACPARSLLNFCLICFVFCALYCVLYSVPYLWKPSSSSEPNLMWVLRQRETFLDILQLANFTAILIPKKGSCGSQRLVSIVVCSAVSNVAARNAIRETWATEDPKNSRVFFLLGKGAPSDTALQRRIEAESDQYGDVIQENFLDSYNNLTVKTIFLLKWATQSGCAALSNFILKIDDDMYLNVRNLITALLDKGQSRIFLGALIAKAKPFRDHRSKWFVPTYVYSEPLYPDYLSGTGYVMVANIVAELLDAVRTTPFFHLEDVYLTGLIANRLGIPRLNHDGFKLYKRKNNICLFRTLISAHMMTPLELRRMFLDVHNKSKHCA